MSLLPPLVLALLAFLSGLLPALRFALPPLPLLLLALLSLAGCFVVHRAASLRHPDRAQELLLLLAFLGGGGALGAAARQDAQGDCRLHLPDEATLAVRGVLEASLPGGSPGEEAALLPLRASWRGEGGRSCRATLRMRAPAGARALAAGTELRVAGSWLRSSAPVLPSAWPRDPLYAGFLLADRVSLVRAPGLPRHPLLLLRGRTEESLRRLFPRHHALAEALLLGRREWLDPAVRDRFATSGLAHLLAISGAHVGLIAAALLLLGVAARLPRRTVTGLTVAGVWLYLAMIGAPASALRAGVMISLALGARLLQRPSAATPMIAAAALVLLVLDPLTVLDPGFQLSFLGVLGLMLGRRIPLPPLPSSRRARKLARSLAEALAMSAAAFAMTAPVVAFHFGQLAPVSILANLPAVPLTSLALVGVAGAASLAPVLPPLARLVADGTGLALDALDRVAAHAAALPYGHLPVTHPQVWWGLAGAAAFLLALAGTRRLRPRVRRVVASGCALAVLLAWPILARGARGALEVHFLDVGQGDAVAVHTPGGHWVLVDAGPRGRDYDAGARRVLPFLRARGATRLEALILTHPDADHIGGAAAVLRGLPVARVVEPGLPVGKGLYQELLQTIEERGVGWSAARGGSALELDGVRFSILWPDADALSHDAEANRVSAVVRVEYAGRSMLLTGDAPVEVERLLVARHGAALRAQVLKAGHHGSATSTSDEFLEAVRPTLAVISVGRHNRYGHPAPQVLERLRRHGIEVARTDREGTITLRAAPDQGHQWTRVEP